jgi:signal transduction histidine kinase/FixJ family two-component response regulator
MSRRLPAREDHNRMPEPLRVLLIEDNPDDALLLQTALEEGDFAPQVTRIESEGALRAALANSPWDIVISDYRLPRFDGLAALAIVHKEDPDLPFILVSGAVGEELAVEAMRAGAGDFVLKGHLLRLAPAVQRELQEAENRRERRRAEADRERLLVEVQRRAAELEAILTSIADGLIVNDPDGRIVTANPTAERLFGTPPERWYIPFRERWKERHIFTPDGDELPMESFPPLRALRGEVVRNNVLRVQIPGRPDVWVSISSAPVRTPEGQIRGAVTIFADITDILELQKRERRMLYTVAHDLRAPATIISGRLQLLLEYLGPQIAESPLQESAQALQRALSRMNRMIDDLTEVTRMEGQDITLEREPVVLATYLPALLQQNADLIDPARVRLELPDGLPAVSADPARLERILLNLLGNAQKYSPPGTPITVNAHPRNGEVVISVTDQGQGIPPDDLPHVFDRFYRAVYKRAGEGIGLGLYITRMLVEAHGLPAEAGKAKVGGRIWVESEVGKGSTFSFTLPMAS